MGFKLQVLQPDVLEPMILNKWYYAAKLNPTQYFSHRRVGTKCFVLYLKWKDQNRWQAFVVENASNELDMLNVDTVWHSALFAQKGLRFGNNQLEVAMRTLVQIWQDLFCSAEITSGY